MLTLSSEVVPFLNLIKSAIELFCRNCSGESLLLLSINTCLEKTLSFGKRGIRRKENDGEGESELKFEGIEDGDVEESRERAR